MTQPYDPTIADWTGGDNIDPYESMVSHGIDMTVTGGAVASVRDGMWHNLGTVVTGKDAEEITALKLLQLAKADYEVKLMPLRGAIDVQVGTQDGEPIMVKREIEVPGKMATYRVHPETSEYQFLGGIVSPKYPVFNNREVFCDWADSMLQVGRPTVAAAGALFEGRQAFMSFKLPREIKVGGQDSTELWLLAHTSHDASAPATIAVTPLRTVCANTCRYNLVNARSRWTLRHTANARAKVATIAKDLQLANEYADQWETLANQLVDAPMTTREFEKITDALFAPEGNPTDWSKRTADTWDQKRGTLLRLWTTDDTQAAIRNTAFAAVQAVGEFCDWETKVAGKKGTEADTARFWRSLDEEKSVTRPKIQMLKAVKEYVGIK